jgi:hypothetical protein
MATLVDSLESLQASLDEVKMYVNESESDRLRLERLTTLVKNVEAVIGTLRSESGGVTKFNDFLTKKRMKRNIQSNH